jgi:hypothetical protein
MIEHHIYRPQDFIKLPWKNGLGYTTELLKESFSDDEFAWRLSIAQVTRDGPFSNFDGYDRTLVLLKGEGMRLEHGGQPAQVLVKPLDVARFPGKGPTTASLHHGPIDDFNVMTRCGICSAETHANTESSSFEGSTTAKWLLIYASTDSLSVSLGENQPLQVSSGHLLEVRITQSISFRIDGPGYIAVEISCLRP